MQTVALEHSLHYAMEVEVHAFAFKQKVATHSVQVAALVGHFAQFTTFPVLERQVLSLLLKQNPVKHSVQAVPASLQFLHDVDNAVVQQV